MPRQLNPRRYQTLGIVVQARTTPAGSLLEKSCPSMAEQ